MVDFCERAPWKICMSNVWKFELCLQAGKNKILKQLPNGHEAHVHGWVPTPGNDQVIICLGKNLCEMCGNLTFVSRQQNTKNGNNCQKCLKHKCMAEFTPGKLRFQTPLFSFQEIFSLFSQKQDGFGSEILGIYIVVTY